MTDEPGKPIKPRIKIKVRTIRALKKYAKEPKCLCCGYNLRGQFMAGICECSECGQACRFEDLSDQIAGQKVGFLPVLQEVRSGVLALLGLPIPLLIIGNVIAQIASLAGADQRWVIVVIVWTMLSIWLLVTALTMAAAYKAFISFYGIWLWILTLIYSVVFVIGPMPWIVWVGMVMAQIVFHFDGSEGRSPVYPYLVSPWSYLVILGATALIVFNQWWSKRLIVIPCRRRCRELAIEYLNNADGDTWSP